MSQKITYCCFFKENCDRDFELLCVIVLVSTWSSWDPCELGQILSLSDHHLDALGQRLVLQQDEQLAQCPWRTHRALPATERFLRTHALRRAKPREEHKMGELEQEGERRLLSLSRCSLHPLGVKPRDWSRSRL